jgi:PEP-CTERM motif
MKMQKLAAAVIFGFVLGINVASAQGVLSNGYFTFDENGYAYWQDTPSGPQTPIIPIIETDPTGRVPAPETVLVYQMPFPSTSPGDIVVTEQGANGEPGDYGDVVTFYNAPTGGGYVIFYSLDTVYHGQLYGYNHLMGTAYADITANDFDNVLANPYQPDAPLYPVEYLNEYISANRDYPEAPGGIGWFIYTDQAHYTYLFISDVPEPSTFGLLALGALGLLWRKRS